MLEVGVRLRDTEDRCRSVEARWKRAEELRYELAVRVAECRCVLSSAVHDLQALLSASVVNFRADVIESIAEKLVVVVIDDRPSSVDDVPPSHD